jgi:hypothetical protein
MQMLSNFVKQFGCFESGIQYSARLPFRPWWVNWPIWNSIHSREHQMAVQLNSERTMKRYQPTHRFKAISSTLALAGLLVTLGAPQVVRADDPPPETKKWESVATAGITLSRGNSKNFLASFSLGTKRTWTKDELLFGASAGYGDSTTTVSGSKVDTVTDSYLKGFGQWNHLFSPKFYSGLRVTGDHDDVASLTYRLTVNPLAGYYFVKNTNSFLAGEFGPSLVDEKYFSESSHTYFGLRVGERGEHKFSTGAKIWESIEYIPKIDDFENYLVNAEAGVSAPISKALSVSLVAQDTYKSVPATGKLKNDLKLIAGLSYRF